MFLGRLMLGRDSAPLALLEVGDVIAAQTPILRETTDVEVNHAVLGDVRVIAFDQFLDQLLHLGDVVCGVDDFSRVVPGQFHPERFCVLDK